MLLDINPFIAVLAAPSLGKRPTEVLNLKSLRLSPLFAGARERTAIKIHSIESIDLLWDRQIYYMFLRYVYKHGEAVVCF